jgi:hypothetical protein
MRGIRFGPVVAVACLLAGAGGWPGDGIPKEDKTVATSKKGVGHWGGRLPQAPDLLGCSWYYNWGMRPRGNYGGVKAEFVPMVWSGAHATGEDLEFVKAGAFKALLGFNEPDGKGQADMTVAEAIALWPKLEATGLRLGSPGTTTGARWLDEFMAEAKARHLRVDFLCLHWYGDITKPDPVGDLCKYLEGYWKKYHLPIWLTEFSGADFHYHLRKTTVEDNALFARESIKMLEALPFVERYAWFAPLVSSRDRNYPTVGLMKRDGTFTPVGLVWKSSP